MSENLLVVLVHLCLGICARLEGFDLRLDVGLATSEGEAWGLVFERLRFPVLLLGRLESRVLTDSSVCVRVNFLNVFRANLIGKVGRELLLEALVIFLFERLHVLRNVPAVDVLLEHLSVKLLRLGVVAGEALLGVGDEDTTVGRALHRTENTGTSRGAAETDVKEALEGAGGVIVIKGLSVLEGTVRLRNTLVLVG